MFWLTLLILVVALATLWFAWQGTSVARQNLELAKTDIQMQVRFVAQDGSLVQWYQVSSGEDAQLVVTNLGGSTSNAGEVHITVGPGLAAAPQAKLFRFRKFWTFPGELRVTPSSCYAAA